MDLEHREKSLKIHYTLLKTNITKYNYSNLKLISDCWVYF